MRFNFSAVSAVWPCWCCTVPNIAHTPLKPQSTVKLGSFTHTHCSVVLSGLCSLCKSVFYAFLPPPLKEPSEPVKPIRAFFLHKMAAVLSAAWQSRGCLCCARRETRSLLVIAPHTGSSPRCCFGLDIMSCSGHWRPAMWAKKQNQLP